MEYGFVELAGAVVSGGLVQTVITYVVKKREQKRSDFDIIVETYSADNRRLREDLASKESKVLELNKALAMADASLCFQKEVDEQSPIPAWIKSEKGIMLWMNDAYEKHFLKPAGFSKKDYRLSFDDEIWPKDTAELFHKSDQHVLNTGSTIYFEQSFPVEGDIQTWLVIKYSFNNQKGVKGIGGFCIPNAKLISEENK